MKTTYIAKALMLYAIAVPIFVWSWLCEQPLAVRIAWLNSFSCVPRHLRSRLPHRNISEKDKP